MPIDLACSLSLEVRKIVFSSRGNDKRNTSAIVSFPKKISPFCLLVLNSKLDILVKDGLLSNNILDGWD